MRVLGLAALLLVAFVPPAAAQALPEGCAWEGGVAECAWTFDTRDAQADDDRAFEVPLLPVTLARITVALDGVDNGWGLTLCPLDAPCDSEGRISSSTHEADRSGATYVVETTIHLARAERSGDVALLYFRIGGVDARGETVQTGIASTVGTFRIVYRAEPLPEGVLAPRPAASLDLPHVRDSDLDGRQPATDIVAVWLDDARLGDGLMEAHLALADVASLQHGTAGPGTGSVVSWDVMFRVDGTDYALRYEESEEPRTLCRLLLGDPALDIVVTFAECEVDAERSVITWTFPEEAVGSPGPGAPFEQLRAQATESAILVGYHERRSVVADEATGMRFPFALGGPVVWDTQNACAFCDPPVATRAWHEAPLDEANLPDTLQVAGAVAALATFLVGILLVRRRRAQTRKLLDEIERVEREHEHDAHAALLALGELESRFTRMFRAGAIQEPQYQVVSQRIASVATRFALRRELGLDDGEPGDVRVVGEAR